MIDAPQMCWDGYNTLFVINNKIMELISGKQLIDIWLILPEAGQIFVKAGLRYAVKRDYLFVT